jgi:flagellar hook assembly protein FlgD
MTWSAVRELRNLFEGDLEAGERWVTWDGRDDDGNRVTTGRVLRAREPSGDARRSGGS